MQDQAFVRMGDGERVLMPSDQVKEDLLAGTQDAAQRAEIQQLTSDELEQLLDIFKDMVFISRNLYEVGCEGINFDTSASAGDADFYGL